MNNRTCVLFALPWCVLFAGTSAFPQGVGLVSSSLIAESTSFPETPQVQGAAKISGTVSDVTAAPVSSAKVTVTMLVGAGAAGGERTGTTDEQGHFSVENLPAGRYKVTIEAAGFQEFGSQEMTLEVGEAKVLPQVTLRITAADQVQVTISRTQMAEQEVKLQEKQRLLGIFPSFYTSYVWDAAPLDTKQKFTLATHSAFDPVSVISIGITAGIEQARNTYPEYGQGAEGYAKRYGASFGDEVIGRFLTSAVYPTIFHEDPRYFYKGTGSVGSRAVYALTRVLITRNDKGENVPNYSLFLGRLSAGAIANLYHPGDNGVGFTFENAALNLAGRAANNLLREFLFKHVTPNVPDSADGQTPQAAKSPAAAPKSMP
jgi:Carboxypeptidase regulatory-like domain